MGAIQRTFGAGAVVATNIDDQSVVEFAFVLNLLDYPANFIIRVGGVGGEDLDLANVESSF